METQTERKVCSRCHQEKPFEEFYRKDASRWDHLCKPCKREERNRGYQSKRKPAATPDVDGPAPEALPTLPIPFVADSGGPEDANPYADPNEPHPKLPQYTRLEVQKAVEVFRILASWRDEDRKKGLIDW